MHPSAKLTCRKAAAEEKATPQLHSGKWSQEEEEYVEALMEEFRAGYLDLQEGTTLRSFLAKMLNCKPKRISKKFEGSDYDGKQLYWKAEEPISQEALKARRARLQAKENKFKECLNAIEIAKNSRRPLQEGNLSETQLPAHLHSSGEGNKPQAPRETVAPRSPLAAAPSSLLGFNPNAHLADYYNSSLLHQQRTAQLLRGFPPSALAALRQEALLRESLNTAPSFSALTNTFFNARLAPPPARSTSPYSEALARLQQQSTTSACEASTSPGLARLPEGSPGPAALTLLEETARKRQLGQLEQLDQLKRRRLT